MIKVGVMTDVHADLPALQAALEAIRREQCAAIYHTGDAIAIGPHPAECLDLLLSTPRMHMILGNHEMWKNCIFDLCGVRRVYRKTVGVVVTSTVEQRRAWLKEVEEAVETHFAPEAGWP